MLHIILISLLSIITPPNENVWLLDYAKAMEVAKEDDKPVLMVFTGSDWCKNCIALEKEVFESKAFLDYADKNLVLLRVDFPRSKKNTAYPMDGKSRDALAEKYNTEGVFPYIVLINKNGEAIANSGYSKGGWPTYHSFFENHLPKP